MMPHCDMLEDCAGLVTHIDEKGYVYCADHGLRRREGGIRCRKLRPAELRAIQRHEVLPTYARKAAPLKALIVASVVEVTCPHCSADIPAPDTGSFSWPVELLRGRRLIVCLQCDATFRIAISKRIEVGL